MSTQSHAAHVNEFESRHCAAEEAALQLGWLRECPYHGEPFRPATTDAGAGAAADATPNDGRRDLVLLASQLPDRYADQCPLCARENSFPE